MSKQSQRHGNREHRQLPEESGRGWYTKGEGTSQRTCMNDHGHGQQCGDGLWEQGMG